RKQSRILAQGGIGISDGPRVGEDDREIFVAEEKDVAADDECLRIDRDDEVRARLKVIKGQCSVGWGVIATGKGIGRENETEAAERIKDINRVIIDHDLALAAA